MTRSGRFGRVYRNYRNGASSPDVRAFYRAAVEREQRTDDIVRGPDDRLRAT